MFNDFVTALQFLTRIKIKRQIAWDENSFARSVKFFPLVGCVIGLLLLCLLILTMNMRLSVSVTAALLIVAEIIVTGGLTCDGYMDTADGVFSGRGRERMLEIMKDSCVGANAVMAFGILLLVKYAVYTELGPMYLGMAVLIMPVITRGLLVFNIRNYKYARESGVGGMFAGAGDKYSGLVMAGACIVILMYLAEFIDIAPQKLEVIIPLLVVLVYNRLAAGYLNKVLGGLTGDTYGFLVESGNLVYLLALCMYLSSRVSVNLPGLPL